MLKSKIFLVIFLISAGCVGAQPSGTIIWQDEHGLILKSFTGKDALYYWQDLAHIIITMFKKYPYLFECQLTQEVVEQFKNRALFQSSLSHVVILFDNNKVVGFSYSIPLSEEIEDIQRDFITNNCITRDYLYIGDTLLYPSYQGKGFIKKFLESHEHHAQELRCTTSILTTVDRSDDYPGKPLDYRSSDGLCSHLGFEKNGMKVVEQWLQVDTGKAEDNILSVWCKAANWAL